jgi:tRNA U34 5-methylaminomethyl-2-thiouridine-forming methyltransferase MnmC
MQKGGFLTTYCSKTVVRKAMQAAGFIVEKHQGMWGKREVVRAINGYGYG